MSHSVLTNERLRAAWIISPTCDLLYLVGTPLLIVPIVWLVSQRFTTPEQIDLVVASFASLGHHLPGFMRCYGDRSLFTRFKWRFILAPPIFFTVALTSAMLDLQGLVLLLLLWGTWHGLMQTYGFMRIYEMKRGNHDVTTARLDFWLCVMIFTAGMTFSDARVYGLMGGLWNCGVPVFDAQWLSLARWLVAGGLIAVIAGTIFNLRRTRSNQHGICWIKLFLAASTAWLYWVSGSVTTNLVVGIAMFEIFHALQYYAIVWSYNRRLANRVGERFGPLGFLFQGRWQFFVVYLLAIAAFGGIRFLGPSFSDPHIHKWIMGIIGASTLLHFYYDGFIWKVREETTQANLDIQSKQCGTLHSHVPALVHAARFITLLLGLTAMGVLEHFNAPKTAAEENQLLSHLATWTPELPELQSKLSRAALERNESQIAITLARHALERRPRWHAAHADLGTALLANQQFAASVQHLENAVQLGSHDWRNFHNLSLAYEGLENWERAEFALQRAIDLDASGGFLWHELGLLQRRQGKLTTAQFYFRQAMEKAPKSTRFRATHVNALLHAGKTKEAVTCAQAGVALRSQAPSAHLTLGKALIEAQQIEVGIKALRRAVDLNPQRAASHYQLGLAESRYGDPAAAQHALIKAVQHDPQHGMAFFELGNLALRKQLWAVGETHYRRCIALLPDFVEAYNNLGALLYRQNKLLEAQATFTQSLELNRENGQTYYNLGLVLIKLEKYAAARQAIQQAQQFGQAPTPEVVQLLKL